MEDREREIVVEVREVVDVSFRDDQRLAWTNGPDFGTWPKVSR
jgi:hypothetical protein